MLNEIEERILKLLRDDPEPVVPVARLHRALVTELGPRYGGSAQLEEQLRRRPDLFLVLEPPAPLWGAEPWPGDLRREYEQALRAAGLDPGPRVALAEAPAGGPHMAPSREIEWTLHRLQASLVCLWARADGDHEVQADLVEALAQAEDLRRVLSAMADPGLPHDR